MLRRLVSHLRRSLFDRDSSIPHSLKSRLALECLEPRQMMAAQLGLSAGVLTIQADGRGTEAYVRDLDPANDPRVADLLLVSATWIDGSFTIPVTKTGIYKITFKGSEQADIFRNLTSLHSLATVFSKYFLERSGRTYQLAWGRPVTRSPRSS
jgi:hypothetical protein